MNNYAITFDIDWAPDFAIMEAAEILLENNIKCTWFITHDSKCIRDLSKHEGFFELGIHPNFFPGSSHGSNMYEVLDHICNIVPNPKAERSHVLYQSTRLLDMICNDYGIEADCNLLLYLSPGIVPHKLYFQKGRKSLTRIPYFWEDDLHMARPDAGWDPSSDIFHPDGLKIFNFHPIHTFLNSITIDPYNKAKSEKDLQSYSKTELSRFKNTDTKGTGIFFKKLVKFLTDNAIQTYTISGLKDEYEKTMIK